MHLSIRPSDKTAQLSIHLRAGNCIPEIPLTCPKENRSGARVRKMLHIAQSSRA
jgi:hypothetical protein